MFQGLALLLYLYVEPWGRYLGRGLPKVSLERKEESFSDSRAKRHGSWRLRKRHGLQRLAQGVDVSVKTGRSWVGGPELCV